jgi:hypothetical protein
MAITRFLNYFFDELEEEDGFVFDVWIHKTLKFLQKNLFDEEIMSIVFVEYNIHESVIKYASCGMPAFFIISENGDFQAIRSNNPPLSIFTENVRINSLPSVSISKMLCYSDGLSESLMHGGKIYGSCLKDDFIDSICVKDFRDKVAMHIGQGDDDLTYIYIQKLEISKDFKVLRIPSTYEAIDEANNVIPTNVEFKVPNDENVFIEVDDNFELNELRRKYISSNNLTNNLTNNIVNVNDENTQNINNENIIIDKNKSSNMIINSSDNDPMINIFKNTKKTVDFCVDIKFEDTEVNK